MAQQNVTGEGYVYLSTMIGMDENIGLTYECLQARQDHTLLAIVPIMLNKIEVGEQPINRWKSSI